MKKAFTALITIVLTVLSADVCMAQQGRYYALFVAKMTENVKWPQDNERIVIGVAGNSSILEHLEEFASLKSNMEVIKVTTLEDLAQCDVLYISSSANKQIANYNSSIGNSGILTVGEDQKSIGKGLDLVLYLDNNKLKFLVSENSLKSKNLTMSATFMGRGTII